MFQRPDHVEVRASALQKESDWRAMFSGYQAGLDSPIFYWQEIRVVFSEAKVILASRNADDWDENFKASLYQAMIFLLLTPMGKRGALKMANVTVLDHAFPGKFEDRAFAID